MTPLVASLFFIRSWMDDHVSVAYNPRSDKRVCMDEIGTYNQLIMLWGRQFYNCRIRLIRRWYDSFYFPWLSTLLSQRTVLMMIVMMVGADPEMLVKYYILGKRSLCGVNEYGVVEYESCRSMGPAYIYICISMPWPISPSLCIRRAHLPLIRQEILKRYSNKYSYILWSMLLAMQEQYDSF